MMSLLRRTRDLYSVYDGVAADILIGEISRMIQAAATHLQFVVTRIKFSLGFVEFSILGKLNFLQRFDFCFNRERERERVGAKRPASKPCRKNTLFQSLRLP